MSFGTVNMAQNTCVQLRQLREEVEQLEERCRGGPIGAVMVPTSPSIFCCFLLIVSERLSPRSGNSLFPAVNMWYLAGRKKATQADLWMAASE